ncbi:dihydroxyacetone kinase DhaL subunit [Paenibacillus sp. 1_12]|uniref:dihydroxyacetone kinase subunit DhaL n=1 Tax=Paenibacillus sp. 1_12 TaxID=1566278 RepID=UPI0008E265F8|nr:dihydroxyacetone kinase subunit DhaL [Paenibacillus sp. 1_12]SFL08169.1 dihydroxyacetone kinase DhaL subunit [Paenibacillus sp. 1_12]
MDISIHEFKNMLLTIQARIEEEKDYLSEMDRALGDGDHGVTMSLGWQAIADTVQAFEVEDCGLLSREVAMSFLNAVGSSVGPLYATAFIRGAAVLQGKSVISQADMIGFWTAMVQGIQERGKAERGNKTMLDTWIPAIESLQQAYREDKDLAACFHEAVQAGKSGMESTKNMLSKTGRSNKLGDRALGHQDPGATSAYVILSTFYEQIKELQRMNVQKSLFK